MIIAKITKQSKVKAIKGYKWHPKEKHWSFPYSDGVIDRILSIFKGEKNELDPTLQVTKKSLKTEINFEDLRRELTFRKYSPKTILYDILMYSFAKEEKNKVYQNLDSIREALIYLMTNDQDFIDAIELSTRSVQAVTNRFDKWRLTLQDTIGIAKKEPRCFSLKLKQELYDNDPTCSICGQRIQNIDDAAIDHTEQYWTGGKTIPENARLTHRYCNLARPRKD